MKLSKASLFIVAMVIAVAQPSEAQVWSPGRSCPASGNNVRCLIGGDSRGQSARVSIRNGSTEKITLTFDEYHSPCGGKGKKVQSESVTIASGETKSLRVLDPGVGATCREIFLTNCGGACKDVVTATTETFVGNQQ